MGDPSSARALPSSSLSVLAPVPPDASSVITEILTATGRHGPGHTHAALRDPRVAHFSVLGLELPSVDVLGRPVWPVPPAAVAKAYRDRSRVVHPDKIHDDVLKSRARDAFEAVKASYAALSNDDTREEVLRAYAAAVKDSGALEDRHADKTLGEKVEAMGKELDERKRLREDEYASMTDEIQRQVEEKRRRAMLVREKKNMRERMDGMRGMVGAVDVEEEEARPLRSDSVGRADNDKDDRGDDCGDDCGDDIDDDGGARRRRQQNRRRRPPRSGTR